MAAALGYLKTVDYKSVFSGHFLGQTGEMNVIGTALRATQLARTKNDPFQLNKDYAAAFAGKTLWLWWARREILHIASSNATLSAYRGVISKTGTGLSVLSLALAIYNTHIAMQKIYHLTEFSKELNKSVYKYLEYFNQVTNCAMIAVDYKNNPTRLVAFLSSTALPYLPKKVVKVVTPFISSLMKIVGIASSSSRIEQAVLTAWMGANIAIDHLNK